MINKPKHLNEIHDPLIRADLNSETIGGATNAAAALGNGGLTVGVSPWSELVYLRWPTPSFYDHLRYVTVSRGLLLSRFFPGDFRYGTDAPCRDWRRYGRPYERHQGLGAKAGVHLKSGELFWMDDPVWDSSRRYEPDASPILVTKLKHNENNSVHPMRVRVRQWVMPDTDLLVQRFEVLCPEALSLFYHATFAPWQRMEAGISNKDSRRAGFAAVYCQTAALLIWFCPRERDASRLRAGSPDHFDPLLLDRLYPGAGVFIAMGSIQELDQFQVGADRAGRSSSKGSPPGAREDAGDGSLQGNPRRLGPVDAGVKIDLGRAGCTVDLLIAVAGTAAQAAEIVSRGRQLGIESLERQADDFWKGLGRRIFVPGHCPGAAARVARRAVLNLLVGRDKASGAIVASPSRQPRYCCDWPRDGAFYDMALDLAGLSELVDAHLEFYRRTQRRATLAFSPTWLVSLKSPFYRPRGHWFSNMITNGSPGFGRIVPIEIDETSLPVWNIWRHRRYVAPARQDAYREAFRDTVTLAVEALLRFVDLKQGWTRPVMEDDDPAAKATLHGASAVLTALAAAADLGTRWGLDPERVSAWQAAAARLRQGMLARVKDSRTLDAAGWRGLQWSLFPAPLFEDYAHPAARAILDKLAEDMEAKIGGKRGGVGYLGEQLFIFAACAQGMAEYGDLRERALRFLTSVAPVPGSDCYGEVGLWRQGDAPGERFIQNRTSIPHLWSGITAYLSVVGVYEPCRIAPLRPPVPKGSSPA